MADFEFLTKDLNEEHQIALEHFSRNIGREQIRFPESLPNGQRLATQAKGIYKPEGWIYALSIRVMLNSPYEDGEFYKLANGGWICSYHEEVDRRETRSSDSLFTNRALTACMNDRVAIGVWQQIPSETSGRTTYVNRGLGGVIDKIGSYFVLADVQSARLHSKDTLLEELFQSEAESRIPSPGSDVVANLQGAGDALYSTKRRIWTEIVQRQGQGAFRKQILSAYEGRCCISGSSSTWVIDAAHIQPYFGPASNSISNGLLLRTDLHTLFDLGLLGIDPETLCVTISPRVNEPSYRKYDGVQIQLPSNTEHHPMRSQLEWRWTQYLPTSQS